MTGNAAPPPQSRVVRNLSVGCLASFAGFFAGGMIAVLVGKIVGFLQRCTPPVGLPACSWERYMLTGALIGLVGLPTAVLWQLSRGDASGDRPGGTTEPGF